MRHDEGYADLVQRRLQRDGSVEIPSSGFSMFPLIRTGDLCRFVPVRGNALKPGAVVLFADREGRLIGHRLLRIEQDAGEPRYILKGDANLLPDEVVEAGRLLGVLASITRYAGNGKPHTAPADNLSRKLWGAVVRRVPGISALLRRMASISFASSVQPARKR